MLTWDKDYSVNISIIDEQHKKLFELANNLESAMRQGRGGDALGKIFNELVEYTATHFSYEEKLMDQYGYPEFDEHKFKHDAMAGRVLNLQDQYRKNQSGLSIKTMDFLTNWLNKHIKGTDREYSAFLNSKGLC